VSEDARTVRLKECEPVWRSNFELLAQKKRVSRLPMLVRVLEQRKQARLQEYSRH
jgi:hypothetical protein